MGKSFSKIITRILKEDGFISRNALKEGPEFLERYEKSRRLYDKTLCMYASISLALYGAFLALIRKPCNAKSIIYNHQDHENLYRKFRKNVKPNVRIKVGDVIKLPKYALLSRLKAKETTGPIYVTVLDIDESSMNVKVSYKPLSRRKRGEFLEEKTEKWIPMTKFNQRQISYSYKN